MIDVDKICNAELITDPWEHKVIDDFFPKEIFEKIKESARCLGKLVNDNEYQLIFINEAAKFGVDATAIDHVIEATDDILDNLDSILKDFNFKNKSNSGYYCMPKFAVTGRNFEYPIHEDSNHKTVVFVVYLDPVEEQGTILYTKDNKTIPFKCIEWKPNRAFVMCPNNKNTWHNWKNTGSDYRITLNIFCEKLEVLKKSLLEAGDEDEKFDVIWLYDQFNKNKLTTNKV
jgi:hypothetical protein